MKKEIYNELNSLLFHTWSLWNICNRDIDKAILSIELGIEAIAEEHGIELILNPINNRLIKIVEPKED